MMTRIWVWDARPCPFPCRSVRAIDSDLLGILQSSLETEPLGTLPTVDRTVKPNNAIRFHSPVQVRGVRQYAVARRLMGENKR
ncbi:hypothetical protein ACLI4R_11510 [Natrialbaceae archaeon A-chndr2]